MAEPGDETLAPIGCFDFLTALRHHYIGRASKVTPSGRLQSAIIVVLDDTLCPCSNRGGLHRCIVLRDIQSVVQYPRGRLLFRVGAVNARDAEGSMKTLPQHNLMLSTIGYDKLLHTVARLYSGIVGAALKVEVEQRQPPPAHHLGLRPVESRKGAVPRYVAEAIKLARTEASLRAVGVSLAAANETASTAAESFAEGYEQARGPGHQSNAPTAWSKAPAPGTTASGHRPLSFPQEVKDAAAVAALANAPMLASWRQEAELSESRQRHRGYPAGPDGQRVTDDPHAFNPGFCATGDELAILVVTHAHNGGAGPMVHVTFPAHTSLISYLFASARLLPGAKQPPHATIEALLPPPGASSGDALRVAMSEVLLRQILRGYAAAVPHTLTVESADPVGYGNEVNRTLGPDEVAAYWSGGL